MNIRAVELADFDNGLLETLNSLQDTYLTSEEAKLIYNGYFVEGQSQIYVVQNEQRIIGCGTLLIEYKFIHKFSKVAHIEDVAINKEFQGLGIGSLLIEHLIKEAKLQGCYKVILDCNKSLIPFYSKCGFKPQDVHMRLDLL